MRRFDARVLALMAANVGVPLALSNLAARGQVSAAHIHITRHLAVEGSRLTDLASAAGMSKQAMGNLVDQCEAWGLVTPEPDPLDARARRVHVHTRWGWRGWSAFRQAVAQAEAEFRAAVGDEVATVVALGPGGLRRLNGLNNASGRTQKHRRRPHAPRIYAKYAAPRPDDPKETEMRILIAEDDQVLADGLLRTLRSSGAAVDHVASGTEADAALMTNTEFDLLILDLGLPKMHGLEVLKKLRGTRLHAAGADPDRRRQRGRARQGAGLRRRRLHGQALQPAGARSACARAGAPRHGRRPVSTIKHGPLVYDQAGRVATIDGKMVELSARELGLLEVLLQRAGRLVSKDQLVERLCEWGEEVSNNAIEVYIHRLRKKIEKGPIRIATVRGLGYCLEKIPG